MPTQICSLWAGIKDTAANLKEAINSEAHELE